MKAGVYAASVLSLGLAWLTPVNAETVIIDLDFRTLNLPEADENGVSIFPSEKTFSFGLLDLDINTFNAVGSVVNVSHVEGLGLGVFQFGVDANSLDGNRDEAINILFRSSLPGGWELAMYSASFIDANSEDNAFAGARWTIFQGTEDWETDRNPQNNGGSANRIAEYNADAGRGNGNGQINQIRSTGTAIIQPTRSFQNRIPGFYGININSGRSGTNLYLSGLGIEMSRDDAEAFGLIAPIPLPAGAWLMLSGGAVLGAMRLRQAATKRSLALQS